jgi:hypothetical protein
MNAGDGGVRTSDLLPPVLDATRWGGRWCGVETLRDGMEGVVGMKGSLLHYITALEEGGRLFLYGDNGLRTNLG